MKKGFTLIELLVVVLIIGVLSAIALPQYQKAVNRAQTAEARLAIKTVNDAVKSYYLANGTYPNSLDELDLNLGSITSRSKQVASGSYTVDVRELSNWFVSGERMNVGSPGWYYVNHKTKDAVIEVMLQDLDKNPYICRGDDCANFTSVKEGLWYRF